MYSRPSSLAAAFINAAANAERINHDLSKPKVDHWVARRVALLADKPGFAIITERDHSPKKPVLRKELTKAEQQGIVAGVLDLVETSQIARTSIYASIEDGEGSLN